MLRAVLSLFLILLYSANAQSAEFKLIPATSTAPNFVIVEGEMAEGDGVRFFRLVENIGHTVVFLSSPGGSLQSGLEIGSVIRKLGFSTAVAANHFCASACALAWLAGANRYMEPTSKIGFHAAYVRQGDYLIEKGVGNALVGAYLNDLGISISAIKYITTPPPHKIQWLTLDDAIILGINVTVPTSVTARQQAPTPAKEIPEPSSVNIAKAVAAFNRIYGESGIASAVHAAMECYEKASGNISFSRIEYCFGIDYSANYIDAGFSKLFGTPQNENTTTPRMLERANKALARLGFNQAQRGKIISDWSRLALLSNTKAKKR